MTFFQLIVSRKNQLMNEKICLEDMLRGMPPGTLICNKNHSAGKEYFKWYVSDPSRKEKRRYLPRSQRPLAQQLARKKLLLHRLAQIANELRALEAYLKFHKEPASDDFLCNSPVLADLLINEEPSLSFSLNEELRQWANMPFEVDPAFREGRKITTAAGFKVRSKSEALIVLMLMQNKIPFRYECPLNVGGYTFYPDFTIRHPLTGQLYYWEHAGMLDDPHYMQNLMSKLRIYFNNGILPVRNLILTGETDDHPLSPAVIQDRIREYFSVSRDFSFSGSPED
ncbi:MAG: hypothetical protein IJG52_08650 [Lachnospiraceae bacterium]|nr:hypothetical protein [Lachnospiraceae bacterium]